MNRSSCRKMRSPFSRYSFGLDNWRASVTIVFCSIHSSRARQQLLYRLYQSFQRAFGADSFLLLYRSRMKKHPHARHRKAWNLKLRAIREGQLEGLCPEESFDFPRPSVILSVNSFLCMLQLGPWAESDNRERDGSDNRADASKWKQLKDDNREPML